MFRFSKEPLCRKIREMFSEYLDNRLDSEKKRIVEKHLSSCEACSKELESLRMTVRLLHRVPEVSVPRSFTIAVPEPKREAVLGSSSLRWLRPATAVASIVLVVLLVGDFLNVFAHEAGPRGGELLNAPPGPTTICYWDQGEGNLTDTGGNLTLTWGNLTYKCIVSPTPECAGSIAAGNVTEGNITQGNVSGAAFGPPGPIRPAEQAPTGQEVVSWPLRQIEIAMGVVVFALAALTVFAVRQRRKGVSVE